MKYHCQKYFSLIFSFLFLISPILNLESSNHRYEALDSLVSKYKDRMSVIVVPLDGSDTYKQNGDMTFVSASMIKLLILAKFMEDVDSNKISLYDFYKLRKEDQVGGAGILSELSVGTLVTYNELALFMIVYSDNTATNVLIDILGMDAINQKAKDLGLKHTELNRKMMDWQGLENYICSDDIETIYKGIYNKTIASERMCIVAMDYLFQNADLTGVAKGLPSNIRYAHKTGTLTNINHDGGIVYANLHYIINVLTKDFSQSEALSLMKTISDLTYQILNP